MALEVGPATRVRTRPPEEAGPATRVRSTRPVVAELLYLQFSGIQGDPNPPTQTVDLPVPAGIAMVATSDQAWLTASPTQLVSPTPVMVSVSLTGLVPGDYQGTVTVQGVGATVLIAVALAVTATADPSDPGDEVVFTGRGFLPGTLVRVIPRLPGVDPADKREWVADAGYGLAQRKTVLLSRTVLAQRTAGTDTSWSANLPRGPYWAVGTRDGEVSYVAFTAT